MAGSEPAKKVRLDRAKEAKEANERLLVEAAQQDRARFADIYENYFELVYVYVARRVGNRAATEDLVAEVFRKALQNLARFRWTGAPFAAWLFRIASNLIADRAKRKAKEGSVSINEPGPRTIGNLTDRKQSQQVDLEDSERRAKLFRLVDELADDQRRVIALRFAEEKSIKQIAAELSRSEGAVKQLQFRALENLRKKISTRGTRS